jgi:uncharacterized SAM-binding protein YcdF (DUF218 family)
MTPVFLLPGKALTEPLFLLILTIFISLIVALRKSTQKKALLFALGADVLLALLSTGIGASLLQCSLDVREPALAAPDVIVVAASGSSSGVLSGSSEERLALGVRCWRNHPTAQLAFLGTDTSARGETAHTAALMYSTAIRMGVPSPMLMIDAVSSNTREHPFGVMKLGFAPSTRIAVATSSWHMRRTLHEFRRHFKAVGPCMLSAQRHEPFTLDDLAPNSRELWRATLMIHEWFGIAWYALRA